MFVSRFYNGNDFGDIFDGTDESECFKPCLSTKVKLVFDHIMN